MPYEHKDNTATLFVNDDKKKEGANPNWPDYKGQGKIDGVDVWISGWKRETKEGAKMLSLSFKPKEKKEAKQEPPPQQKFDDEFDSGPPF